MVTEAPSFDYQPMNFAPGPFNFDFNDMAVEKENIPPPPSPLSRQNIHGPVAPALPNFKVIENADEAARMEPDRPVIYKAKLFTGSPTRFSYAEALQKNTQSNKAQSDSSNKNQAKVKKGKAGNRIKNVKKSAAKKRGQKKTEEPVRPPSYIICLKCMQFQSLPLYSHSCEGLRR